MTTQSEFSGIDDKVTHLFQFRIFRIKHFHFEKKKVIKKRNFKMLIFVQMEIVWSVLCEKYPFTTQTESERMDNLFKKRKRCLTSP